jgi:6-phosphofructokinase 1
VIRAVTRTALRRYGVHEVLGFRYGYAGLVAHRGHEPMVLGLDDVAVVHRRGGSILGVSRGQQDVGEMVDGLVEHGVNALIAIGGDGTLRGIHALHAEIEARGLRLPVVGVPKTIDNDIGWVQRSFGLDTAVAVASQALNVASTEARSAWGGVGLVRLMGRESGFITAHATLGFFSLDKLTTSPLPVTNSMAETGVARLPFFTPEPCVAVAHAPATEICGSDARLWIAKPRSSRYLHNSP